MKFFNKKEEVLDLQLTQYGKNRLSLGKFKPVFYAFFDDNILYDSEYASFNEKQNDINNRIMINTPQLKTQYVKRGIESEIKTKNEFYRRNITELEKSLINPSPVDNPISQVPPLGYSELGTDDVPYWKSVVYLGEIKSSEATITGSYATQKIPQIDINIDFPFFIVDGNSGYDQRREYGVMSTSDYFLDGTYFNILENQLLMNVFEENTDYNHKNFDLEFFIVEEEQENKNFFTPSVGAKKQRQRERLRKLKFRKPEDGVKNGILEDSPHILSNYIAGVDSTYVEYYFDFEVDDEIDFDRLCATKLIRNIPNDSLRSDLGIECEDLWLDNIMVDNESIYASNVTDQDIEDCE